MKLLTILLFLSSSLYSQCEWEKITYIHFENRSKCSDIIIEYEIFDYQDNIADYCKIRLEPQETIRIQNLNINKLGFKYNMIYDDNSCIEKEENYQKLAGANQFWVCAIPNDFNVYFPLEAFYIKP